MRRSVFDYPDHRLGNNGGWVRVRHEGDKITMSYKQLSDRTVLGMSEVALVVDSFDSAVSFLTGLGLKQKAYQETRRELWTLGGAEITIDTWPWIPTFVEIEAPTESVLRHVAGSLGFVWERALHGGVETAYEYYYNVPEEEVTSWPEMVFGDGSIPDWLKHKRK
jgi:adenylate cyclase class 2